MSSSAGTDRQSGNDEAESAKARGESAAAPSSDRQEPRDPSSVAERRPRRSKARDKLDTPPTAAVPESGNGKPLPDLPIGGPAGSGWREEVLARAAELETLTLLMRSRTAAGDAGGADALVRAICGHLDAAKNAAQAKAKPRAAFSGANVVRATRNLHAAESGVLRLASTANPDYVQGQLPTVQAYVHRHLPRGEISRARVDAAARKPELASTDREAVLATLQETNNEARRGIARVRSFRNVLLITAAALTVGAVAMALIGIFAPDAVPLCFHPGEVVCPTKSSPVGDGDDIDAVTNITNSSWDIPLVEIAGALAAAIAAATSLRRIKGTSTPYSLPVALAVLKLPTGALTAVLGLLLMRGEFVPGLSALDTPGQIVAWAVVFGYSQQLFTRLVDNQAQSVLDNVGAPKPSSTTAQGGGAADENA
jgi:hypothetical protein